MQLKGQQDARVWIILSREAKQWISLQPVGWYSTDSLESHFLRYFLIILRNFRDYFRFTCMEAVFGFDAQAIFTFHVMHAIVQ
jgi:hypothetical protein